MVGRWWWSGGRWTTEGYFTMTSRKTMSYAGALASAVALALAGCNGGDKEATASPTPSAPSSSTTSSPSGSGSSSASATPSPTSTVRIPSKAQANTEEGAIEFAKFYVLEMNRADVNADPSVLIALSSRECRLCQDVIAVTNDNREAGTRLSRATTTVQEVVIKDSGDKSYTLGVLAENSATTRIDRAGKKVADVPSGRLNIEMDIAWTGNNWSVTAMDVL